MQKNKHRGITLEIRRRIQSGALRPEEQLPTRMELERKFKVSRITMQKAIGALVSDGTVHAEGTYGTFVSKFPMEIYRYGLVFHHKPDYDRPWTRQWNVIRREAEVLFSTPPYQLSVFNGDRYYLSANGDVDFMEAIRNRRMAGLILTMSPELFEGTELLEDPEIPRVTLNPGPACRLPSVRPDTTGILGEMAKHLLGKGRSRTSLMMYSRQFHVPGYVSKSMNELREHGLETHDVWIHGADVLFPQAVANTVSLMMKDVNSRPDSIMILDDNLIPAVIEGLRTSKVRVPRDVELVAMVNFPYEEKLDVPVKMFGFDVPAQLRLAKAKLDAMRQGLEYEKATLAKFISDTEFSRTATMSAVGVGC